MNNDDIFQGICCGCSACANICPTNSITMQEDENCDVKASNAFFQMFKQMHYVYKRY